MNKNKITIYFLMLCFGYVFSSCVNQKKYVYFQKSPHYSDTLDVAKTYVSKVHSGDILSVFVTSLSADASTFFNPYQGASAVSGGVNSSVAPGYLVDSAGNIDFPLINTVKVEGLTTVEIKDLIKSRLNKYLKEPTVNVRVLNYRISVLGDVSKPAVYVIPNESVTLPEALSLAGDLAITGRRDNILIIRNGENGKKEFGHVDLTKRDIYNSPYYFLHANDVIYVEPGKNKAVQGTFAFRLVPFIVGIISAALLIFVRLR
jgi:polysaccharide export outer membrane protein